MKQQCFFLQTRFSIFVKLTTVFCDRIHLSCFTVSIKYMYALRGGRRKRVFRHLTEKKKKKWQFQNGDCRTGAYRRSSETVTGVNEPRKTRARVASDTGSGSFRDGSRCRLSGRTFPFSPPPPILDFPKSRCGDSENLTTRRTRQQRQADNRVTDNITLRSGENVARRLSQREITDDNRLFFLLAERKNRNGNTRAEKDRNGHRVRTVTILKYLQWSTREEDVHHGLRR